MRLCTTSSTQILKARAYLWNGVDPGQLGMLLLDDYMVVECDREQLLCSLFLFETMLLCCRDAIDVRLDTEENIMRPRYPVHAWELGPALSRSHALNILYTVPTDRLKSVQWLDQGMHRLAHFFRFFYSHSRGMKTTLRFTG